MSVGVLVLVLLLLGALAVVVPAVIAYASGGDKRAEIREANRKAVEAANREKIAVKALRQIANGDALPVITAGDALDEIETTYQKEINS